MVIGIFIYIIIFIVIDIVIDFFFIIFYRSIMTSTAMSVFEESVVYVVIVYFDVDIFNALLLSIDFGYHPSKSATINMATFYYYWTLTNNNNYQPTSFHFQFNFSTSYPYHLIYFYLYCLVYFLVYFCFNINVNINSCSCHFLQSTRSANIQIDCHLSLMLVQKQIVVITLIMTGAMCVSYCYR